MGAAMVRLAPEKQWLQPGAPDGHHLKKGTDWNPVGKLHASKMSAHFFEGLTEGPENFLRHLTR